MELIFRPGKIGSGLVDEVACVLAKRTEIASREKLPGLWNKIDKINTDKAPENVLRRRKTRHAVYGAALIAMGIFLFVPGIMKPKELFVPLVVGAVSLISGIFAVMPQKNAAERFEKKAQKLIKSIDSSVKNGDTLVFGEECITENGALLMEYENIAEIFETKNLFFISDGIKAILIRKCDLVRGNNDEFCAFIGIKTGRKIIKI
ncbi:MAG: hypothetical protein IJ306_00025 [Oscillospiraceae bacterium]|nr:hypothetical protein [Oscillospiraceae bacterium]